MEVRPPWPFRLRGGSADGLLRRRGPGLQRLLHRDGAPVHVAVVQRAPDRVLFAARAASETDAMWGIRRLRFATGVDDDLRPFHEAHRDDPVIGRAVRAHPELRVRRAPLPWETLVAAVCEQLIEFERAIAIQRRLIAALGPPLPGDRPARRAHAGPAWPPRRPRGSRRSTSRRAAPLTLRRAAAEVAAGRADLLADDPLPAWRRLRAIPGIGPWTLEMLALHGQGHHDRVPAGDLGYLKLVGRLRTGRPAGPRGGGRRAGVLRALRRVEGPRGRVPAARGGDRAAHPWRPGSSPSPGRNSFVIAREPGSGRVISSCSRIQAA